MVKQEVLDFKEVRMLHGFCPSCRTYDTVAGIGNKGLCLKCKAELRFGITMEVVKWPDIK
jgi:hypothetical protein